MAKDIIKREKGEQASPALLQSCLRNAVRHPSFFVEDASILIDVPNQ